MQKIVAKPKNNSQPKVAVVKYVNAVDLNIKIDNFKHIKDDGILLGCELSDNII